MEGKKLETSLTLISLTASSKDTIIKQNKQTHTHGEDAVKVWREKITQTHTQKERKKRRRRMKMLKKQVKS